MNKNIIKAAAVASCAVIVGGVSGCGTKTIIVQSGTENSTTQQQPAVTGESNSGQLSKKDTEIMTTAATTVAATVATTDAASNRDEYYFYDSDTRLLTEADLEGMSAEDLRLARNEIFARRGRKFKEKELSDYYSSKSWYNPTIDSDDFNANAAKYLNDIEIKNVEFIKSVEDRNNKDEYYFYDSDTRLLTEADLKGLSPDDMRLARNEIFARRGRKFKEKELSDYFSSKSWYKPTIDSDDFNANVTKYLNKTEIKNADFIKSVEKQRVLDAIEGKWGTIRLYDDIEYTFNGDTVENNIGRSYKITDVVRAYSCANTGEVIPGEAGYMIFTDSDYYEVSYYYLYDNEPNLLELHTENNGRHMSYGGDSLERVE